ncbi:MAG: TraR/DksA family transcriptional regulator [Marinovum sp.]|nr:TraR/DksA family transcriptional regulator [Marinovum sp.]
MDDVNLSDFRRLIQKKLAEIDKENTLGAESQQTVELDQQSVGRLSRMDALQAQAMARAHQVRRDGLRQALLQALLRIEEGEFGYCSDCGDLIPHARLELNPALQLCIGCARG